MEYTTSSRYVTFMERPMAISAFNFTRRLGFQAQWQGYDWLRISGGVTGQEIDNLTLRANIEENMKRSNRGSGANWTGKVVVMPWASESDKGLHIGYNVQQRSGRWISDEDLLGGQDTRAWYSMRADSRNATAVNRVKFMDTRMIPGVRKQLYQGFEFAGYYEGFRFGSEFIIGDAIMDKDLFNFPTFRESTDPNAPTAQALADQFAKNKKYHGFYVQAGYLLFGGKQRYNIKESEFTQVTRGKSWGDIEVLFRYDYLNLNNAKLNGDQRDKNLMAGGSDAARFLNYAAADPYQQGGSGHNFTFGLTYWINSNVRFIVNYMISKNDIFSNGGGALTQSGRRNNMATGKNAAGLYTANPYDVVSDPGVGFNTLQLRLEIAF
jgi:phosphate-selective porin OprO/OprP